MILLIIFIKKKDHLIDDIPSTFNRFHETFFNTQFREEKQQVNQIKTISIKEQ